ncbi:uncharacterized protein LOC135717560 [Ochlerotatus camptorhynchus]|uniref:uncharacterized protein LOC135717560 n=1 Tax=Ochlerotatus camptorhynchus TaxID=644619 RepID=UPI0031D5FE39
MNILRKCGFCQQPAALMCSRCLEVYCSFECQIRDWSEHKQICVTVPKLYPNNSYLELLTSGVRLPLKGPAMIEQGSIRLVNNGRSLKSNFPMGSVEVSVDRKATDSIPDEEKESDGAPSMKTQDMFDMVENVKRVSKMKIEDVSQRDMINGCKSAEYVAEEAQTLTEFEPGMVQSPKKIVSANNHCKPWMLHFPLEKADGEVFDVVIQHVVVNQPMLCWVVLPDHESQCNQLLRDINVQIDPSAKPVKYDDIQVDDVYTGLYEDLYYRVVILEKIDPARSLVRVRLIDYGNELTLPASDLRAPLPRMKDLRAFAFLIEIQNLNRTFEPNAVIRISLIRSESDRKIVEMVLAPESLLDLLGNSNETTGEGGIVAILSSRKALILFSSAPVMHIMKVLYTQLAEEAAMFPSAKNSEVGDLICVNSIEFGWSRALIIDQHDDNRLVYTIDNGTVELVSAQDVRKLPAKYKHKPRLVLAMEITKVVMNEQDFMRMCYMPSFEFTFERLSFNKAQQTMKCTMKDGKGKFVLAEVDFMDFECDLKKVGIDYWPHTPQDKMIVRILSALDVSTIVICPKDSINVYTELLQTVIPNLKRLTAVPNVKDVIVAMDDCMMPYRARVLSIVSSTEVEVLDLDNGKIRNTFTEKLFETNGFVNNLPVYTLKVRILDMNVSAIKDQVCVLRQLDAFKSEKREFRTHFEGRSYMYGVKLIDVSTNRSLATILLEHHDKQLHEVEKAVTKKREQDTEAARLKTIDAAAEVKATAQAAAAKAKQERKAREATELKKAETVVAPWVFTINDLKLVELPVGKSGIKLTILDDANLAHGVVTVFEFTDENIKRYTTLNDKVNEEAARVGGDGYCPKLDELCIAVFDDDKLWYRAVCLQAEPEKDVFMVQFIDFGNLASVNRESIRSLPKELAFPCAAHTCTVIDHINVMKTLVKKQASMGYVVAQHIVSNEEQYSLKF